jgi:hypothetical protein
VYQTRLHRRKRDGAFGERQCVDGVGVDAGERGVRDVGDGVHERGRCRPQRPQQRIRVRGGTQPRHPDMDREGAPQRRGHPAALTSGGQQRRRPGADDGERPTLHARTSATPNRGQARFKTAA